VESHGCLTVDKYSVISVCRRRTPKKVFPVCSGRNRQPFNFEAQSLLGVEGFAEGLRHLVTEKQQIREIPKGQRFVGRPSLEKLLSQRNRGKASRDRRIAEAVTAHGYSQMEVASFLGLHYSTISRILAANKSANLKT
jgi:hypothetical protein